MLCNKSLSHIPVFLHDPLSLNKAFCEAMVLPLFPGAGWTHEWYTTLGMPVYFVWFSKTWKIVWAWLLKHLCCKSSVRKMSVICDFHKTDSEITLWATIMLSHAMLLDFDSILHHQCLSFTICRWWPTIKMTIVFYSCKDYFFRSYFLSN